LNDTVRENKKQALISYLLTLHLSVNGKQVADADSLYEYLLIDVQMTPAVVTSRLIQATMTVQLFASRCLLGLENTTVAVNAIAPSEWEWMKHYRISAGLKKLFVYVENYLDPSLRDDKSEFFKELESELNKSDITDINAENAFRDYLHKLNEVSKMEMCGMYNDTDTKTLHVFARTHAAPYNYYYRTQDSYGHWAAWEKLQLDIKSIDDGDDSGVHLMPVIWKKRLFLFFPEFMEKSTNVNTRSSTFAEISTTSPNSAAPQKYWEIRLAWSEYANGKWAPKKLSKEILTPLLATDFVNTLASVKPRQYLFRSVIDTDNALSITLFLRFSKQDIYFSYDYGAVPIASFKITDIHERLSTTSQFPFENGTTMEQINELYERSPHDFFSPDSNFYEPFFQSMQETNHLSIAGIDILKKNAIRHQILFSNEVSIPDFERNLNYPFFCTDIIFHRIYFATPVNTGIFININGLKNATTASLALFDTDKLRNQNLGGSTIANSMKATVRDTFNLSPNQKTSEKAVPSINKFNANPEKLIAKGGQQYLKDVQKGPVIFNGIRKGYYFFDYPELELYSFYHPFAPVFIKKLNEGGVPELLAAGTAEFPEDPAQGKIDTNPSTIANDSGTTFDYYNPNYDRIKKYYPADTKRNYYLQNVDFSEYGTYSIYNWELFFHAPFLIAQRLSKNGKYAEARQWFHYIFNPLSAENPGPDNPNSPYWRVLPFKTAPLSDITGFISRLQPGYDTDPSKAKNTDDAQIDEWRADPFNAFLIARNRPIAFMKNVVMSYLDNLIAWGDDLFKTYTRENINEATQLYVMAAHILGPKPQYVPKRGTVPEKSYNMLGSQLDDLGDAVVSFENQFPNSSDITQTDNSIPQNLMGIGQTLYFCVPANGNLLQYWTKVGDRLFKIRHGQNIDGIVKPLALYEPPFDPLLLLKAKEQGLDINNILSEIENPTPQYRFTYLLQKAKEFCD
ncbi:MAG TPA: neuraminidase-like domain-containing protein, partial [Chitinophagaceae bacterium]|nr:neuraminidase-like domain-containing protein [Chitinophagaceae bacterium]